MLEMGVVDVGLSPDEFWELSYYEWGLYILRFKKKSEHEKFGWETGWEQTRQLWATLVNLNVPKGKGVKPSDLIKLSFDTKTKAESKRKTPEEVMKKFGVKGKM